MRRLSRYLIGLCAVLMLLGNNNCSKNNDAGTPQFVTSIAVQDANNLPASAFAKGDTIKFVLTIRNRSNSSQTLWFNSSQEYNLAVVQAGTNDVVWNWDATQTFTSQFTSLEFTAGETKTFTVTWDQAGNDSVQVDTGKYEVIGGFTVYNTTGAGSAADNADSMAQGAPTAGQLFPTVYRALLTPFTIQ